MNLQEIEKDSNDYERFISKITIKESGCWEIIGAKDKDGYAFFWVSGKSGRAHRFSYEIHKGKIPKGLVIDHLCRNRGCQNPDHLEPVTVAENNRRGELIDIGKYTRELSAEKKEEKRLRQVAINKLRAIKATHCKRGHERNSDNIYFNNNGHKCCKRCLEITPCRLNKKAEIGARAKQRDICCQKGHLRTMENTYIRKNGKRSCRICKNLSRKKLTK